MEFEISISSDGTVSVRECYDYSPDEPSRINPLKVLLVILTVISVGGIISVPLPYIMAWDKFTNPYMMMLAFSLPILLVSVFLLVFSVMFLSSIGEVEKKVKELETESIGVLTSPLGDEREAHGIEIDGKVDMDRLDISSINNEDLRLAAETVKERERAMKMASGEDGDFTAGQNIIADEYMTRRFAPFFNILKHAPILLYVFLGLTVLFSNILGFKDENLVAILPINLIAFLPMVISSVISYKKYMSFSLSRGKTVGKVILVNLLCLFFVPGIALLIRPLLDLGNSVMLLAFCVADIVFRVDIAILRSRAAKGEVGEELVPRFFLWRSLILFVVLALVFLLVVCGIALVNEDIYAAMDAIDRGVGTDADNSLVVGYFVGGGVVSVIIITVIEVIANLGWYKSKRKKLENKTE